MAEVVKSLDLILKILVDIIIGPINQTVGGT